MKFLTYGDRRYRISLRWGWYVDVVELAPDGRRLVPLTVDDQTRDEVIWAAGRYFIRRKAWREAWTQAGNRIAGA